MFYYINFYCINFYYINFIQTEFKFANIFHQKIEFEPNEKNGRKSSTDA